MGLVGLACRGIDVVLDQEKYNGNCIVDCLVGFVSPLRPGFTRPVSLSLPAASGLDDSAGNSTPRERVVAATLAALAYDSHDFCGIHPGRASDLWMVLVDAVADPDSEPALIGSRVCDLLLIEFQYGVNSSIDIAGCTDTAVNFLDPLDVTR